MGNGRAIINMKKEDLSRLKKWFTGYVASYYTGDREYDRPIRLKEDHTARVCENILLLGQSLDLSEPELILLEVIGLFHDIGRFEQYKRHGTFVDSASEDHARLGIRQLARHSVLSFCRLAERRHIARAIAYHNAAVLPERVDEESLIYMRLIRDADKLDVWRVLIDYYRVRDQRPSPALELGVPDDPSCSPEMIDALYTRRSALLKDVRNVNDAVLLQISWVFDLNFPPSIDMVRDRQYVRQLRAFLPQTEAVQTAVDQVESYLSGVSSTS